MEVCSTKQVGCRPELGPGICVTNTTTRTPPAAANTDLDVVWIRTVTEVSGIKRAPFSPDHAMSFPKESQGDI